jgi:hypothetical protein
VPRRARDANPVSSECLRRCTPDTPTLRNGGLAAVGAVIGGSESCCVDRRPAALTPAVGELIRRRSPTPRLFVSFGARFALCVWRAGASAPLSSGAMTAVRCCCVSFVVSHSSTRRRGVVEHPASRRWSGRRVGSPERGWRVNRRPTACFRTWKPPAIPAHASPNYLLRKK